MCGSLVCVGCFSGVEFCCERYERELPVKERDRGGGLLWRVVSVWDGAKTKLELELELELIQTQMTQKPMLRVEVGARALRNQTGGGVVYKLKAA